MKAGLQSIRNWPLELRLPMAAAHAFGLRMHQAWLARQVTAKTRPIAPTLPCLVVGGLRLSGSGKSTVTAEIARIALSRGLKVALLCYHRPQDLGRINRAHHPSYTDPLEVTETTSWEMASDEALWLKKRLPTARVYVTRHRQLTLEWLTQQSAANGLDWVLCDDGLWDPRITATARLILDHPEEASTWRQLYPAGLCRGLTSLTRSSDFWACSDSNPRLPTVASKVNPSPHPNWIGTFRRLTQWPTQTAPPAPGLLLCSHGNAKPMQWELERQGFRIDQVLHARPHGALPLDEIFGWAKTHPGAPVFMSPREAVKVVDPKIQAWDGSQPFQWTWSISGSFAGSFAGSVVGSSSGTLSIPIWVCAHSVALSDEMNQWVESMVRAIAARHKPQPD